MGNQQKNNVFSSCGSSWLKIAQDGTTWHQDGVHVAHDGTKMAQDACLGCLGRPEKSETRLLFYEITDKQVARVVRWTICTLEEF